MAYNTWELPDGTTTELLTPAEYDDLPDGIVLISISGDKKIKGKDSIDQDTRGGFLAWGLFKDPLSTSKISVVFDESN